MKIKVEQVLKDIKGEELKDEKKNPITLKTICVDALLSDVPEKKGEEVQGNEKMARFVLAEKIQKANELDLKSEEIVKIKNIVGSAYAPLIVGRVFELLN